MYPPCNPVGIPCMQRHNEHPQNHARHDARYCTATHSTMSAAILRTPTHTERNGYTAHDRPSQACTYNKRRTHHTPKRHQRGAYTPDCAATPHTASRRRFHPGQRMAIHAGDMASLRDLDTTMQRAACRHTLRRAIRTHSQPGQQTPSSEAAHVHSLHIMFACLFIHARIFTKRGQCAKYQI